MRILVLSCCTLAIAFITVSCATPQSSTSEKESKSQPAQTSNSASYPDPNNFPSPNFPSPNFPSPNFPSPNFPNPHFPEINFPTINFPEITFPEIRVQQNKQLTVITLPSDILFDFDKYNIRPDAEAALRQISEVINKRYANNQIQINGHTDAIADEAYNQTLSERRAAAVRAWLSDKGKVAASRMAIKGYGESQPVAPNTKADGTDDPQARQKNRRVEIVIQN